jgi:hypothetical protein
MTNEEEDLVQRARSIPRGIGGYFHGIVQELIEEILKLRAVAFSAQYDAEMCRRRKSDHEHAMAREIESLRELAGELRDRNNRLLHRLQEFEAREAE